MSGSDAGASETFYARPDSIEEAVERLQTREDATVLAGGQTLMLLARNGTRSLDAVVDVSGVEELHGVKEDPEAETATAGAGTTYTEMAASDLCADAGAIDDAVAGIADRQVRNLGTVGGAVVSGQKALDVVAVFLCFDAELELVGPDGRRTLPIDDFYRPAVSDTDAVADADAIPAPERRDFIDTVPTELKPTELVVEISLARPARDRSGSTYRKQTNVAGGWTAAGAATRVTLSPDGERIEDVRVALAAVAPTAVRAPSVEDVLVDERPTDEAISAAAGRVSEDVDPPDDPGALSQYRSSVAETLTRRALTDAIERARAPSERTRGDQQ